jgi:eukaryotic-like serine/threonine-protein kinase
VLRDSHRSLAEAWEREPTADAELVAEHWVEAGDSGRAARFTVLAAEQADRALAFDRAARLYQRALDLSGPVDANRRELMLGLGRALANAGRGRQAAAVYLQTPAATVAETLDLQTQAAQQYLFAGHMADGLAVIRDVLNKIGMVLPSSRWRTLLELLWGRAALRLRGLGFRETPVDRIPAAELIKVDVCWSVAAGLSIIDTMRGAVFQSRHLLLALRTGDLGRIHRALCLEVGFVAAAGARGAKRAKVIRDLTAPLTQELGTSYGNAMHAVMEGVNDYLLGNWKVASRSLASAEELLATKCTGVTWELDSTRFFRIWAHYYLGDLQTFKATFPVLLKDAEERGDLYASATINGLFAHIVYLADANPTAAASHARDAIARWAQPGFHMPSVWRLWSETDIAIYERRAPDAWKHVSAAWSPLQRSLLLEVQMMRVNMLDLKARAALAAAWQSPSRAERRRLLSVADRCASKLGRQGVSWAAALGLMLRAGIADARGEENQATTLFAQAHEALSAVDMLLHANVAKRRHGQLAGELGTSAISEVDEWMAIQGVQNPAAMAQMFAPHK